jgi:protocatechuate 3,4-dioxygenase beta subunit
MKVLHSPSRREVLRGLSLALPLLPLARLEASGGGSSLTLVGPSEPGTRLSVAGTVVRPDGSPAAGIRLSVYHTDADGYYTRPVSDPRRARIRGSVVTDAQGRYAIHTIQPGFYPDRRQYAHIHVHVDGAGYPQHWIDSFLFEGDPYLGETEAARSRAAAPYGYVMALHRDASGVVQARRDIRLDPQLAERNRLVDGWYRQ